MLWTSEVACIAQGRLVNIGKSKERYLLFLQFLLSVGLNWSWYFPSLPLLPQTMAFPAPGGGGNHPSLSLHLPRLARASPFPKVFQIVRIVIRSSGPPTIVVAGIALIVVGVAVARGRRATMTAATTATIFGVPRPFPSRRRCRPTAPLLRFCRSPRRLPVFVRITTTIVVVIATAMGASRHAISIAGKPDDIIRIPGGRAIFDEQGHGIHPPLPSVLELILLIPPVISSSAATATTAPPPLPLSPRRLPLPLPPPLPLSLPPPLLFAV